METLGGVLRRARRAMGLSQQELAERAGLTASGVSQLERGVRTRPYPSTIRALADALELDTEARTALLDAATMSGGDRLDRESLPPSPDLIGRERDLSRLLALLAAHRLVTVTGPGGVGKTSLAIAAGHALIDRFPGGAVFVGLADIDEVTPALSTIGCALGLTDDGTNAIGPALRTSLGSEPTLLILDNLEQLVDLGKEIADLVANVAPLTVLATSRAPLRVADECEFRLRPLAVVPTDDDAQDTLADVLDISDAVRLLRHRTSHHDVHPAAEDSPLLEAICRQLDGLPLAIELVAPWLRVLTPREIIDRLADTLPLLVDGPTDRPTRHRTMRDTIRWSEALLEPWECELFHRLAILPGNWDLTTAAAVIDWPEDEALRGTGRLVECNLVHRVADGPDGRARFRMLETVRAYAHEQLVARGDIEAATERLALVTAAFCDEASGGLSGPRQATWLAEVDRRFPDVRTTLRWALRNDEPGRAGRCYVALMWSWYLRHTTEADAFGHRLLETGLPEKERGRVEATLALVAFARGDLETSREIADRAARRARRTADTDGLLRALMVSVNIAAARGLSAELEAAASELRETATRGPSPIAPVARAVTRLAEVRIALAVADHRRAQNLLAAANREVEEAGTPWLRVLWLNVAVACEHAQGHHTGTAEMLERSIALCLELDDAPGLMYALASLTVDLALEGRALDAARIMGIGESHAQRTGHQVTDPNVLRLLAQVRRQLEAEIGATAMTAAIQDGRGRRPRAALQHHNDATADPYNETS